MVLIVKTNNNASAHFLLFERENLRATLGVQSIKFLSFLFLFILDQFDVLRSTSRGDFGDAEVFHMTQSHGLMG